MTGRKGPTRRAFLGRGGEAAGAVTASAVAGGAITGAISGCTGSAGAHPAPRNTKIGQKTSKAENSLPGEPHWWIKHVGPPDAIQGFTGQASVLPGEPVTPYVSTTAREFRGNVLRMGWYGGYLAPPGWRPGRLRGHKQKGPTRSGQT